MANVNEIADDLKVALVMGEERDAVNVCRCRDCEIDCAAPRRAASVSNGG